MSQGKETHREFIIFTGDRRPISHALIAGFRAVTATMANHGHYKPEINHDGQIKGSTWANTCDKLLSDKPRDLTTSFILRTATRKSGGRTVSVVMEAQAGDTVTRLLDAIE